MTENRFIIIRPEYLGTKIKTNKLVSTKGNELCFFV